MRAAEILGNNPLMMVMAFVTAIVLGGFPDFLGLTNSNIAMLSLMVVMTLSLTTLNLKGLRLKDHSDAIWRALFLSFVLSSGTTILMSFMFQGDIQAGWIIEAAVPSAVSVIPFTFMMKGDLKSTLVASVVLYFVALVATPMITLIFLGHPVDQMVLVTYIAVLILLPMALSFPLKRFEATPKQKGMVINMAFFVLIVAIAGPNRGIFFSDPIVLAGLIAVAVIRIFVIGLVWNWYLVRRQVPRGQRVPEVLFSSYKNTGMAATLAFGLIGPAAAVPATVCVVVEITWLIFITKFLFSERRL